jgi:hypothetical protein
MSRALGEILSVPRAAAPVGGAPPPALPSGTPPAIRHCDELACAAALFKADPLVKATRRPGGKDYVRGEPSALQAFAVRHRRPSERL